MLRQEHFPEIFADLLGCWTTIFFRHSHRYEQYLVSGLADLQWDVSENSEYMRLVLAWTLTISRERGIVREKSEEAQL